MGVKVEKAEIAQDVEAVITSFNQGNMIREAVQSLWDQTVRPVRIRIVDDGSTDPDSVRVLEQLEADPEAAVPVEILRQENAGVSAARNAGIRSAVTPLVLVLDGDDRLEADYLEKVRNLLREYPAMVAASSWMHTFGVLDAMVCPSGGTLQEFLSRNCCPATHIHRRELWEKCGGYDECMRSGFEDWDFFLSMLETVKNGSIGIVEKPLIDYRTTPVSSNIRSMSKRLELMHFIIEKHKKSYREHVADAILGVEAVSISRLYGWENEILHEIKNGQKLSKEGEKFIRKPSYGDGGMAAAVRIASGNNKEK